MYAATTQRHRPRSHSRNRGHRNHQHHAPSFTTPEATAAPVSRAPAPGRALILEAVAGPCRCRLLVFQDGVRTLFATVRADGRVHTVPTCAAHGVILGQYVMGNGGTAEWISQYAAA